VVVNGREINNQWAVPYNRDFCVKYDAHINVERVAVCSVVKYCTSMYIKVITVLLLYLKVVQDTMTVSSLAITFKEMRSRNIWTVVMFLLSNHVGVIFEFSLQFQYPSVTKLQYHLPREQLIVFHDREDLFSIVDEPNAQETTLTMWFEANKAYPKAGQSTYLDSPRLWVWNHSSKR